MKHLLILLLLGPLVVHAQTWPDKNCEDKPYTKPHDDHIYHTTKCETDSLYCTLCQQMTSRQHVMARIKTGFLMMAIQNNLHMPTPLGSWMLQKQLGCLEVLDWATPPPEYRKYLPADFVVNQLAYYDLINTTRY